MATQIELAWAAGLFDGEGWIGTVTRSNSRFLRLKFQISQTDRQILDRFRKAVGLGKVFGPYYVGLHKKLQWKFEISKQEEIVPTFEKLIPYLSPVKREQGEHAVKKWTDSHGPKETTR